MKLRQNIIRIILAFVVLTSGNFAFAVSHGDCLSDETGHHKCEMECCAESDCCAEDKNAVELTSDNNGCCDTHIEQAVEQNDALLILNKASENLKAVRNFSLSCISRYSTGDYSIFTHKFKTTNISIELSNLRI